MAEQQAKVYCDTCDKWLRVQPNDRHVRCDCGRRFLVTVTELPTSSVA